MARSNRSPCSLRRRQQVAANIGGVPDHLSKEGRSRNMAAIRAQDTGPELALRRALWKAGARGWRCHRKDLPGKPDLAWSRGRLIVQVDGAYWHGHPDYVRPGASEYWTAKIRRNRERDKENDRALRLAGWEVIRLWDFEIADDLPGCVTRVLDALSQRREPGRQSPGERGRPSSA